MVASLDYSFPFIFCKSHLSTSLRNLAPLSLRLQKLNLLKVPVHFSLTSKQRNWDFPGCLVVKNPPVNAGDTGFDPWSGKTPRAMGQQNPFSAAREAPAVRSPRTAMKSSPRSWQIEKARVQPKINKQTLKRKTKK